MSNCLCDFVSTVWLHLLHPVKAKPASSLDSVLDTLTSRQIQIELQDRRCVSEAKRHHACGSKALFRAKMLEHRRLQAQLLQLQRYRENVHAQMDAMTHHEINQTFMRAMAQRPAVDTKEVTKTIDELHETLNSAKEMTELLGQPIDAGVDVMDEDLEQEFMETMGLEQEEEETLALLPKTAPVRAETVVVPPPRELALPAMMMAS
jgi:hypothetical protein